MPRKNNDHVSLYSEETSTETNAGLVMRIYRIVPHIPSAVYSTLYMCNKSAIDFFLVNDIPKQTCSKGLSQSVLCPCVCFYKGKPY